MKELELPEPGTSEVSSNVIEVENSVVVVGPNGCGKTRLGTWIEFNSSQKDNVHRISAQKSLSIPGNISPTSMEKAKRELQYGNYNPNLDLERHRRNKQNTRWGNNPATVLLEDYGKLLTFLFSEDYENWLRYKEKVSEEGEENAELPKSKLDRVKEIWESIIPHRNLKITSGVIKTVIESEEECEYNAAEMSDGERVILYLIGESLSAPEEGIIVIDEPEIHLHKSIQRELWDTIENERPDCLFVYLTHDLDFASTRLGATKICLNDYDGENFYWYPIEDREEIPEDIYLEILGSRDPILFVEGDVGSYDEELYALVYPNFTIKPVGSCEKVIEITKSFGEMYHLHNLNCHGIIDRDYRPEEHLETYRAENIHAPGVAEVENLFLIDEVLLKVAERYCEPNPEEIVETIHEWVFEEFKRLKEKYATEATAAHVNYLLNGFDGKFKSIEDLKENYSNFVASINIEAYYTGQLDYANRLITEGDYLKILQVFNHKGLVRQVGKFFDIKPSSFTTKVKNIIESGNEEIVSAFKKYLPEL